MKDVPNLDLECDYHLSLAKEKHPIVYNENDDDNTVGMIR